MKASIRAEAPPAMGRKKGDRETVMVRTYKDSAEKLKQASAERGMTAAEFIEKHLLPHIEKAHRDYIQAEAKKLGKDGDK